MKKKPQKEKEHITDGTPCWCNPKIVSYKKSQPQEEWEKELDKFWDFLNENYNLNFETGDERRIKADIKNLISEIRKEERERIINDLDATVRKRYKLTKPDLWLIEWMQKFYE